VILRFYRKDALSEYRKRELLNRIQDISKDVKDIETEFCYNVLITEKLSTDELAVLKWLLSETFQQAFFSNKSFLAEDDGIVFEVGPRLNWVTAWSTCAVSICHSIGIKKIKRI